jgi:hypothetical protein
MDAGRMRYGVESSTDPAGVRILNGDKASTLRSSNRSARSRRNRRRFAGLIIALSGNDQSKIRTSPAKPQVARQTASNGSFDGGVQKQGSYDGLMALVP